MSRTCATLTARVEGSAIALQPVHIMTIAIVLATLLALPMAGGAVAAKNIPNHGARVEVYLPLTQ
jgi:hypothetical protein